VFIEDLYNPGAEDEEAGIEAKFDALKTHLDLAGAAGNTVLQSSWYIGFASGYNGILTTPDVRILPLTLLITCYSYNWMSNLLTDCLGI